MKPAQDKAELVRRGILTLAMAAIGVIVLMFQEEPGTRRHAVAAPQAATTTIAPGLGHAHRERGVTSAAMPAEAAPCLLQAGEQAAQRYGRFSRLPAQAGVGTVQVLRPARDIRGRQADRVRP